MFPANIQDINSKNIKTIMDKSSQPITKNLRNINKLAQTQTFVKD